ncbi:MAG: hypothetical protein IPP72_18005 [Chitinophagaceae bacterium]|nr:hypothetical protein [Chitinophagaceae bacterium]
MKREYWINVKHVDNRLVIYLNGSTVWDSGIVHEDPELNHMINITELLHEHPHHTSELIFEGFNDTYNSNGKEEEFNPWHFHYHVIARTIDAAGKVVKEEDMLEPYNQKHFSNPNIRAINNKYDIVQKGKEFRVVSNELSQHFFK